MARISHESSNVDWTEYDEATGRLTVRFHSGKTYSYEKVSSDAHEALINADSVGRHLMTHIVPNHGVRRH